MTNRVDRIVFPLSGGVSLSGYDYYDRDIISIPYASVRLDELKKTAKLVHKQNKVIAVTTNIYMDVTKKGIFILPTGEHKNRDWVYSFSSELYGSVTYEWLLEQIKTIENGVEYTEYCLLQGNELIVFNTENPYNHVIPINLLKVLKTVVEELMQSKVGFANIRTYSIWNYFTEFIIITEETPSKVILSNKAKLLIAEMKLKGIQNTTIWYVLQGISSIVDGLQQKQVRKLP